MSQPQIPAESMGSSRHGYWLAAGTVVAVVLTANALVCPIGEYPILDDWAYLKSLHTLHTEGRVRILDWNPMSLVGHLLWGFVFTKSFGFSFTVARSSVFILHLIELLAVLGILRSCGVRAGTAVVAALALALHPLHFVHCATFMSDIPALTWQVVSMYFFVTALGADRSHRVARACAGSVAAGIGYLVRQGAILPAIAFVVHLALFERGRRNMLALVPAAVGPASTIVAVFQVWYHQIHGPTAAYPAAMHRIIDFIGHFPVTDAGTIVSALLVYIGTFAAPLAFALSRGAYRLESRWAVAAVIGAGILVFNILGYDYLTLNRRFPFLWNVVTPYGYFMPNELFVDQRDELWGNGVAWTIGVVGVISTLCFAALAMRRMSELASTVEAGSSIRFMTVLLMLQCGYAIATSPILFDRHLLAVCATAVVLFAICSADTVVRWRYCVPMLAAFGVYSVMGTHDLHAGSRIVAQAASDLLANNKDPVTINGGYAFDGWQNYDRLNSRVVPEYPGVPWWRVRGWHGTSRPASDPLATGGRSWWYGQVRPDVPPLWVVAALRQSDVASLNPEFEVVRRYPCSTWWSPDRNQVYVLKRRNARASDAAEDATQSEVDRKP